MCLVSLQHNAVIISAFVLISLQVVEVASKVLVVLRHLYFVVSRLKIDLSTQYSYVYSTAIDVLAQPACRIQVIFHEMMPGKLGTIALHPLDRYNDLFFFNTVEHFTSVISSQANEDFILAAAMPYLDIDGDPRLAEIHEAAHSVVLSIFSGSDDIDVVGRNIGSYSEALFKVGSLRQLSDLCEG